MSSRVQAISAASAGCGVSRRAGGDPLDALFETARPAKMRSTKMPGVWMASLSSAPTGTSSSTSATVTLPAVAIIGLKFRAVFR